MRRYTELPAVPRGPCFTPEGNLVLCLSSGRIIQFEGQFPKKGAGYRVLSEHTSAPFGCFARDSDSLLIADCGSQSVITTELSDGRSATLCREYERRPLIGPTAVVADSHHRIFFSDSGDLGECTLDRPRGAVYCISTKHGTLQPILGGISGCADIAIAPDSKCLYVCEQLQNRVIRLVETMPDVFIASVFVQFRGCLGPSSVCCDRFGNVYVTRMELKHTGNPGYLSVLNSGGDFLITLPTAQSQVNGIAYDRRSDCIVITESSTKTVDWMPCSELRNRALGIVDRISAEKDKLKREEKVKQEEEEEEGGEQDAIGDAQPTNEDDQINDENQQMNSSDQKEDDTVQNKKDDMISSRMNDDTVLES